MGVTGLLSGTLLPWFSGGMGPPQAKLLSNRGRRVAGHSLLLSQEASPTSKDRANTPHKTLEGQGNADESEKKWIQVTHQPVSHPQEENPATNMGHSLCLQAGQDFYSTNRGCWAVHFISAPLASKTSPPLRNGHPQRPLDATAAQLTPLPPSDWSIQGFLTCSCRGFDPPWTSMA